MKKKTIKAWAVIEKESGDLTQSGNNHLKDYVWVIDTYFHKKFANKRRSWIVGKRSFKVIPCIITYKI